jgi:hypothetical protein
LLPERIVRRTMGYLAKNDPSEEILDPMKNIKERV